jgi:hypothetical protein
MIRILTLAAAAAVALSAPASAAEQVRVSTVGKTTQQLHADIAVAARKVCLRELAAGATFPQDELSRCVKASIAASVAQAQDPALSELAAKIRLASR